MSVTPLKKAKPPETNAPFQTAVSELAANEMIFAVVGPVGSGTSEIAEALESLLAQPRYGYDTKILKARTVIEAAATRAGIQSDCTRASPGYWPADAGDKVREGSKDNAAVAVGLIQEIRTTRAVKQNANPNPGEAVEPDGTKRITFSILFGTPRK